MNSMHSPISIEESVKRSLAGLPLDPEVVRAASFALGSGFS
jgi:hypothetical protein